MTDIAAADALKLQLSAAHRPNWRGYIRWLAIGILFLACQILLIRCVQRGPYWPIALLVPLAAILMHGHLMAFHEAAHRTLVPIRWWNDAVALVIAPVSFMSLTAYRALHRTHHRHLATVRDEELWPFTDPSRGRGFRAFALFVELFLGIFFMPLLCLRTFLRRGSPMVDRGARLRTWLELALIVGFWSALITLVAIKGWWLQFAVAYLLPAWLAGNIQGFRESVEHLGLAGTRPLAATRSIVPGGPAAAALSACWFHIEYHGLHHRYGSLPQSALPKLTPLMEPTQPGDTAPYSGYLSALRDMLRGCTNPRIGPQWNAAHAPINTGESVGAERV